MPKDKSKFKGREQFCIMHVDDNRYVKVKSHSIELKKYYGNEEEYNEGSNMVVIERAPGYFSLHERGHTKKCLAIDPEWKGQKDTETKDEVNNLITCEKYEGKPSQLFRLIKVSKKKTKFHLVS